MAATARALAVGLWLYATSKLKGTLARETKFKCKTKFIVMHGTPPATKTRTKRGCWEEKKLEALTTKLENGSVSYTGTPYTGVPLRDTKPR
jgi:hypothetical protein